MPPRRPALAVWRLVLLSLCVGHAASAQGSLAFVDVAVVPMDSARAVPHQTVVVEDGRLTAIGPSASTAVPPGALVVDGSGRFLMPGLADMHVHLTHPEADGYYHESNRASFDLLLAHGVTTVRNMWGSPGLLALRDSVAAGLVLAPRFTTTGPFVEDRDGDIPGPWSPSELESDPLVLHARSEADGRDVARYHADAGYDYVKVRDRIPAAAYRGLTDEAGRLGLRVVGHAPRAVGLGAVLTQERQISVEHVAAFAGLAERSDSPARSAEAWYDRVWGSYAHDDPERVGLLAQLTAASQVWVTPTLLVSEWYGGPQPDMLARLRDPNVVRYTSAAQRESWREYAEGFATNYARWGLDMGAERAFSLRMVRALDGAGARLLLGTDATPAFGVQGIAVHEELALMVEAGLTPFAALRTATVNAQTYLRETGFGTSSGTVRVDEPADLVLLDANPLDDVGHARQIRGVMTRGQWLDRTALDGLLTDAEARYRDPSPSASPGYGTRTPRANADAPTTAYVGGLWYQTDGDARFVARDTTWSVDGVFVADRPARIDTAVALGARYVVPPFADAHQHDVEGPWSLPAIQAHLDAGDFYVKVVNNAARYPPMIAGVINRPDGLDVTFSHASITAPGAHPVPLYRRLVERGIYRDLDADSLDGVFAFGVGSVADLERRWPDVLAQRSDHLKLLLLDHESGAGLRPDVFRRAVELARAAGLRTTVHVLTAADLAVAVDAGANEAAHLPGFVHQREPDAYRISPSLADSMATRRFVTVTTTTVTTTALDPPLDPPALAAVQSLQAENVRTLLAAGAPVAIGTDLYGVPGVAEAENLVRIGAADDATALRLLVETGPVSIYPDRAIGRLAPGYEASFLTLDCDPTADLGCARQIRQRVKQGQALPPSETADRLD